MPEHIRFFNFKCFINIHIFVRFRMAIRYIRHLQAILEFGPEYETKLYAVPCTQYLPPPTYYGYQPPYGQCWTASDYAPNMSNPYWWWTIVVLSLLLFIIILTIIIIIIYLTVYATMGTARPNEFVPGRRFYLYVSLKLKKKKYAYNNFNSIIVLNCKYRWYSNFVRVTSISIRQK